MLFFILLKKIAATAEPPINKMGRLVCCYFLIDLSDALQQTTALDYSGAGCSSRPNRKFGLPTGTGSKKPGRAVVGEDDQELTRPPPPEISGQACFCCCANREITRDGGQQNEAPSSRSRQTLFLGDLGLMPTTV